MPVLQFKTFTGEFPRLLPHSLPENAAQTAVDCDFMRGHLVGVADDGGILAYTSAKSLYIPDSVSTLWFAWGREVDAVRGPIVDDQYNRFYWSDGTGVYVSRRDTGTSGSEPAPSNKYLVGVPRPASAPTSTTTTFTLPFVSPGTTGTVTAFCEDVVTKERTSLLTSVPYTQLTNTATMLSGSFNLSGLSCAGSGSTGTPGSGAATWIGAAEVNFKDATAFFDVSVADAYQRGTELLFKLNATLPAGTESVFINRDGYSYGTPPTVSGKTTHTRVYRLGASLWYSTVSGATVPTSVASTASSDKIPAVSWKFTTTAGTTVEVIFRPSGVELPAEFDGIEATATFSGTTLTFTFSRNPGAVESRAYTYTYVNQYGEEGAPADPLVMDVLNGQPVVLRYAVLAAGHGYVPVTKVRVYRTSTGSQSTEYLYVGEATINPATPEYTDTVKTENLGEPISTLDFLPPESDLRGLCNMGNGILAAFRDNEVHFCRPYLPYAWRPRDIQPMPAEVKGMVAFENGLYVTTAAEPVLVTGVSPDSLTNQKVPALQAGVSRGSITNVGPYIAYASNDGIVMARGLNASLDMSLKFFTREVWRARYGPYLDQMRFAAHDGNLLVYFTSGQAPFLIRFEEENPSLTQLTTAVTAHAINPVADALYVVRGGALREFKGAPASRKAFTWRSKDFILPKPLNFGLMQLVGAGYVTVNIYADGGLKYTRGLTLDADDNNVFRLPAGFLARRWAVEFVGNANAYVTEAYLATSPVELQNV